MDGHPTVGQIEGHCHGEQADEQDRRPAHPALHETEAAPEEVTQQYHHRGPSGSAQRVVKQESAPAHATYACDQRSEYPDAREEARQEHSLAPVAGGEGPCPAPYLRGGRDEATPPQ